jgi:hypothetical protein
MGFNAFLAYFIVFYPVLASCSYNVGLCVQLESWGRCLYNCISAASGTLALNLFAHEGFDA